MQAALDALLVRNYSLSPNRVHVLLDIPIERGNRKLGQDIRVQSFDHNGELVGLETVSGIVQGLNAGFENTLQRVRVFLNPQTYDDLGTALRMAIDEIRMFISRMH